MKGRTHDIQTRHVHEAVDDFIESAARMVTQIHKDPKAVGHVLVFMPGALTTMHV